MGVTGMDRSSIAYLVSKDWLQDEYGIQHNILSATVIAKDCTTADAYATAFMVMGLEKAKAFCEQHPELNAYFICTGENDKYEVHYTPGMEKLIVIK